jgi:hypothetical protein
VELKFDRADLKPLIESIVAEMADRLAPMDDRISVDEAEAARLIGVAPHVLRDARRRGEVGAAKIGKKHVYLRLDLVALVQARKASGAR